MILGTPFICQLFPIQISDIGIITEHLGTEIIFEFIRKPISKTLNPIELKGKQINSFNFKT